MGRVCVTVPQRQELGHRVIFTCKELQVIYYLTSTITLKPFNQGKKMNHKANVLHSLLDQSNNNLHLLY